jgi:hypothetical protein
MAGQTPIVEGNHAGAHIVDEPSKKISRKKIVILTGITLKAGAVLGQVTASKKYVELNPAAADGSQSAAGVLFDNVTDNGADQYAMVHVRECAMNALEVVWKTGMSAGEITTATAQLDALNIVLC